MIAGFYPEALAPSMVNGVATGAFYAFIAIPLVLSFRVSRSVAFVHGGIATLAGILYWWLTSDFAEYGTSAYIDQYITTWPRVPTLLAMVLLGALLGFAFGSLVMIRLKLWPRVAVTTFSLGGMIFLYGVAETFWSADFGMPSPFGTGKFKLFGQSVTVHQLVTLLITVSLATALTLVLSRTKTGMYVRAVADDIEAAQIVGIPVERVGIGVWTVSGAISALAGICIMVFFRVTVLTVLVVFLQAVVVGVLGGFRSLPLVLLGAFVLGQVESIVGGGAFGTVSGAAREIVLMFLLFATVAVVNVVRHSWADLLEEH